MSFLTRFQLIKKADKSAAVEKLIKDSTPDYDFFLLIILSVLMATFGLLIDSTAVVIGSMLIAPLLYPVISLALGMAMSDHQLIGRSLYTILKAAVFGVAAAAIATLFFTPVEGIFNNEILSRTEPSLPYFLIAIVAGLAVTYAMADPDRSEAFPGIAVSVALIPPLAVLGIGIASFEWAVITGSLVLFLVNIIGIVFAGMVSFSLMNLYETRRVAKTTIKKEEKRIEQENQKIEKIKEEMDEAVQ